MYIFSVHCTLCIFVFYNHCCLVRINKWMDGWMETDSSTTAIRPRSAMRRAVKYMVVVSPVVAFTFAFLHASAQSVRPFVKGCAMLK